jgi:hypothetical protein
VRGINLFCFFLKGSSNFAVDDSLPGVVTYKTQLEGECVTGETLVLIVTVRILQIVSPQHCTKDLSSSHFRRRKKTAQDLRKYLSLLD